MKTTDIVTAPTEGKRTPDKKTLERLTLLPIEARMIALEYIRDVVKGAKIKMLLRKYTQAEFDAIPRDRKGRKICPPGDYTSIR